MQAGKFNIFLFNADGVFNFVEFLLALLLSTRHFPKALFSAHPMLILWLPDLHGCLHPDFAIHSHGLQGRSFFDKFSITLQGNR